MPPAVQNQSGAFSSVNCEQIFGEGMARWLDDLFCKSVTCTTRCVLQEFVGKDLDEAPVNAHKEVVMRVLEKIAHETANKWAKKGIPVLGEVDLWHDAIGAIKCTTDCVRN